MKVAFICRASTGEGFGHLVRCQSMIEAKPADVETELIVLSDNEDIVCDADAVVFDLNKMDAKNFGKLSKPLTVSLSPLFEHIANVDLVFNRTKYLPINDIRGQIYAGLEYTVIGSHCQRVNDETYQRTLMNPPLAVGLGMAGRGFWEMAKHYSLLVCNVGITLYEAVYAGMPALALCSLENFFLARELWERGACLTLIDSGDLHTAIRRVTPELLAQIRANCDGLIDNQGAKRIWEKILQNLNKRRL